MNTGRLSRAQASQIGSSSGSSILRRDAVGLLDREAEALRDLADADGACRDVRLELLHGLVRPTRTDVLEVDAGEDRARDPSSAATPGRSRSSSSAGHPTCCRRRSSCGRSGCRASSPCCRAHPGCSAAPADGRGSRSPGTSPSAPCARAPRAATSAGSRECSARETPAPCSCADESRSCRAGTPRRVGSTSHCRAHRLDRRGPGLRLRERGWS